MTITVSHYVDTAENETVWWFGKSSKTGIMNRDFFKVEARRLEDQVLCTIKEGTPNIEEFTEACDYINCILETKKDRIQQRTRHKK